MDATAFRLECSAHTMNASQNDIPPDAAPDGDEVEAQALYALGALEPAEAEQAAQQAATDAAAQRALTQAEELVGQLGLAAPLEPAPASLRRRVFAQLDDAGPPPAELAEITTLPRRSRTGYVLAAAAAVLILVLGSVSAILWQRLEDRTDELDALQAELAQIQGFDEDEPLIWIPLASPDGTVGVSGWLCRTPDGELAWVVMRSEPLPPEQVMQLWLIDEQAHSAGTFVSDADGRSLTVLLPDRPLTDFEMLGITVEPAGGSTAPTTNPFVLTEIS